MKKHQRASANANAADNMIVRLSITKSNPFSVVEKIVNFLVDRGFDASVEFAGKKVRIAISNGNARQLPKLLIDLKRIRGVTKAH